jgi:ornithine carbamoyltransferase
MRSLLAITDLSVEEINSLIEVATDIEANPEKYQEKCKNCLEINNKPSPIELFI